MANAVATYLWAYRCNRRLLLYGMGHYPVIGKTCDSGRYFQGLSFLGLVRHHGRVLLLFCASLIKVKVGLAGGVC